MQSSVYEFPTVSAESDDGMATVDSLGKDISALAQRLTAVETELRIWNRVLGAACVVALAVGSAALGWCIHIGNKVAVIESGGNTSLITELKAPKSPEQLRANLSTVIAQVQTARANGNKPNAKKIEILSSAVSDVTQSNPDMPEVWQATGELISYRGDSIHASALPDCLMTGDRLNQRSANQLDSMRPDLAVLSIEYHDCELNLSSAGLFERFTSTTKTFDKPPAEAPTRLFILVLTKVRVIYRGGPLPPIIGISFTQCSFDFQLTEPPPQRGKALMQALLATDPTQGNIKIPEA